ncbi:kynureninase [Alteromonas sp. A079]|uniref:kynureninase n=1 Tax=Alteromonas sp. A079 TaxID=3410268 RepID=UPI003BA31085
MIENDLDNHDALRHIRSQFSLPEGIVYLDGNSLGPLPTNAKVRAKEVVEKQWGDDLITSWNKHSWINLPSIVGDKIGAIVGAEKGQIVSCDSISVNLFKALSAALKLNPTKKVIATTRDNFPTDIYMVQGLIDLLGDEYTIRYLDERDIEGQLSDDIAVLMLTQVNFRSGFKLDMASITESAHASNILTLWDLAHSAGAFPVELDACNVDFAVGCTYKYLNGGPGAPAFIYVAFKHQAEYKQPLSGWMGHNAPFAFSPDYVSPNTVKQNLCGTPGIVSMSILDAALSVFEGLDINDVAKKSVALQEYFIECMEQYDVFNAFEFASPTVDVRGSQLAFRHEHAYAICQAWIARGVIADFRAPDILRIGFAPLYLRFDDIRAAVEKLASIMNEKTYLNKEFQQKLHVT